MNASESCYDNAFMESCFGTLKTELELVEYASGPEVLRELTGYIRYYNGECRHSSLGHVSPAEFERHQGAATKTCVVLPRRSAFFCLGLKVQNPSGASQNMRFGSRLFPTPQSPQFNRPSGPEP